MNFSFSLQNFTTMQVQEVTESRNGRKPVTYPPRLLQCVDSIVKKEGYVTYHIDKKSVPTDGFLGVLYNFTVKGLTKNGEKETHIFVKHIMAADKLNAVLTVANVFLTELYFYKELSAIFTELQDEVSVPYEDRYNMVKSYEESYSEAIILENVSRYGFKTGSSMDVVSLEVAEHALQQLAKFHALSFVLKHRRAEYFEKKIKTVKQQFTMNDDWKMYARSVANIAIKHLEPESKRKAANFISIYLDKYVEYVENTSLTTCCLVHGDFRPNNVLVKEVDGEVSEVVIIDFQLMFYGCPVNDFLHFIFIGTDQKFRREHLSYLKNVYFEALDRFLQHFALDINSVYPRTEFEKAYKDRLDCGLMIALHFLPYGFAAEDSVPDLARDACGDMDFEVDSRFKERMQGIVDDFIEWGYL